MAKSIRVINKKRRGRPVTTGKGTLIGVRLQPAQLKALDKWAGGDLSRPEAIRQLVEAALTPKPKHAFCLSAELVAAVDAWKQEMTTAAAIAKLIEIGLKAK